MRLTTGLAIICILILSCGRPDKPAYVPKPTDTVMDAAGRKTVILAPTDSTAAMNNINTGRVTPHNLIDFARTAIGVPYKYASSDPKIGFDCSGFITYVFNHFGVAVPRTSVDFTHVKHEVPLQNARPGDLILFTGEDSQVRVVGHMGIVVASFSEPLQFIHATSGHDNGVTISYLTPGYQQRFIKVIRIFPQNEGK